LWSIVGISNIKERNNMANYESATVYTENKELSELLVRHFKNERNNFYYCEIDKNQHIHLRNRHGNTLSDLHHLSILYSDIPISLEVSYESERYGRLHKLIVTNGDYDVVSVEDLYDDEGLL